MAPRPIRASSVISACCFRLDERKGSAPRETRIASQRIQMMRRSISIAEASSESVPAGLRAPSLRLMALLTGAGLAGPLQAILPWFGARDFIEVEQHLGAIDQVIQELLGDAGATLARDRFLQLLELVLHQMMDGLVRGLVRFVARAQDQVDGVEAALRRLALV